MAVTSYYSVGGEIFGEETSGTRRDYLTDSLGSVTGTVTAAGAVENTYRYKPYGDQLSKTGAGSDPKFLWNGKSGYRQVSAEIYVRKRSYNKIVASWLTVDPLWPIQPAYAYTSSPALYIDYKGTNPKLDPSCIDKFKKPDIDAIDGCITNLCSSIGKDRFKIQVKKYADKLGLFINNQEFDYFDCLANWCKNGKEIKCTSEPLMPGKGSFCDLGDEHECNCEGKGTRKIKLPTGCAGDNCQYYSVRPCESDIYICTIWQDILPECPNLGNLNCYKGENTIIHEITHMCFQCLPPEKNKNPKVPFDTQIQQLADCIYKEIGCRSKGK